MPHHKTSITPTPLLQYTLYISSRHILFKSVSHWQNLRVLTMASTMDSDVATDNFHEIHAVERRQLENLDLVWTQCAWGIFGTFPGALTLLY